MKLMHYDEASLLFMIDCEVMMFEPCAHIKLVDCSMELILYRAMCTATEQAEAFSWSIEPISYTTMCTATKLMVDHWLHNDDDDWLWTHCTQPCAREVHEQLWSKHMIDSELTLLEP